MSVATASAYDYASICDSSMFDWIVDQHRACHATSTPFDTLPATVLILFDQYSMIERGDMAGYDIYADLSDMLEHVDHLASLYHDEMVSGEKPYYYYYIMTRFAVKLRESIQTVEKTLTKPSPPGYRKCFGLDLDDADDEEAPIEEDYEEYHETLEEYAEDNEIIPSAIRAAYRRYEAAHPAWAERDDGEPVSLSTLKRCRAVLSDDEDAGTVASYPIHWTVMDDDDEDNEPMSPPPLRRCNAVVPEYNDLPEWAIDDLPEWAVDEDEDDEPTTPATTEQERPPSPIFELDEPSLFRFDSEIPITAYLSSEENADLFMAVMHEQNEWQHSDIVPDRLYNYLSAPLREHVDAITQLLGLGWSLPDNIHIVHDYINNTPTVRDQIDDICNRLKGYLFEADFFAYKYVGKFILLKLAALIGHARKYDDLRLY